MKLFVFPEKVRKILPLKWKSTWETIGYAV